MDYCSPCSRTLNGAVTCPECGAYDPGAAQSSEGKEAAATVETPMPWLHSNGVPNSSGPSLPGPPAVPQDPPADRNGRPARLKRYAVRSLAAATFTLLGGLATASVLPHAAAPRAASTPEQPSLEGPEVRLPDAQASPERASTHPARKGVQDRDGDGTRRPPPATRGTSPAPRSPSPTSAPPSAKAKPTPRATSTRRPGPPPRTAVPSPRPSASPSASASAGVSASPTSSGSPSGDTLPR